MEWLDSISDSMDMNLRNLWEIVEDRRAWGTVEDRRAWGTVVHELAKSWT